MVVKANHHNQLGNQSPSDRDLLTPPSMELAPRIWFVTRIHSTGAARYAPDPDPGTRRSDPGPGRVPTVVPAIQRELQVVPRSPGRCPRVRDQIAKPNLDSFGRRVAPGLRPPNRPVDLGG